MIHQTIEQYDEDRANQYDESSALNKGNRQRQINYLEDILSFYNKPISTFLELGCGTAFFTEALFQQLPLAKGICIDGSKSMLEKAKEKLATYNTEFIHGLFEDLEWNSIQNEKIELIFSSLAIHHLTDDGKQTIFKKIYDSLSDDGLFILFESFLPRDNFEHSFIEYLACKDVQRNLKAKLVNDLGGEELPFDIEMMEEFKIDSIIQKDRKIKSDEGDKEASIQEHLEWLTHVGFSNVLTVFQESRYAGIVAFK